MGHAFISYGRQDAQRVDALQQILTRAGIRVWRDTADLWPGQDWKTEIRRAIGEDALVFIACFSREGLARARSYQNTELLLAIEELQRRRPDPPWLIPVRFDDCKIPDLDIGGGRMLPSLQSADLFGDRYDQNSQRLIQVIQRILRATPVTPADAQPAKGSSSTVAELGSDGMALFSLLTASSNAPVPAPRSPGWVRALFDEATALPYLGVWNPEDSGQLWRALLALDPVMAADIAEGPEKKTDPNRPKYTLVHTKSARWGQLADVAPVLAAIDPYRAERIASEAERLINGSSGYHSPYAEYPGTKMDALAFLARKVASSHPDRARRLANEVEEDARTHTAKPVRVRQLAVAAAATVGIDPGHARELFTEAESIARSFRRKSVRSDVLSAIMRHMVASDPGRAEQLYIENGNHAHYTQTRIDIAAGLAERDPVNAEQIARRMAGGQKNDRLLMYVAGPLASHDPPRAIDIARSIGDHGRRVRALARVARVLVPVDPAVAGRLLDDAEQLARTEVSPNSSKAAALASIIEIWLSGRA